MNKDFILRVAQTIEESLKTKTGLYGTVGFNMAEWIHFNEGMNPQRQFKDHVDSCGTTACIAGWACLIDEGNADNADDLEGRGSHVEYRAAQLMGLEQDIARDLFMGGISGFLIQESIKRQAITAEQAIRTLRHLAETGEVNWLA